MGPQKERLGLQKIPLAPKAPMLICRMGAEGADPSDPPTNDCPTDWGDPPPIGRSLAPLFPLFIFFFGMTSGLHGPNVLGPAPFGARCATIFYTK